MTKFKLMLAAAILTGMTLPGLGQESKVAVIDLERTFDEYYKTKTADAQLKEQAEDFTSERKALIEEYDALQKYFDTVREEAQNRALSEEVRDVKRNEAEAKLMELQEYENKIRRFDQSRKKQLDEQSIQMRTRIVDEIKEQLQTYAVNQGYSLVIDYSGQSRNGVPIVLYSEDRMDITDEVLALINQEEQ